MVTADVWGGLLAGAGVLVAVGLAVEGRALLDRRRGDTLSEFIRPWARRHRGVFLAVCGLLVGVGAWLPHHILG